MSEPHTKLKEEYGVTQPGSIEIDGAAVACIPADDDWEWGDAGASLSLHERGARSSTLGYINWGCCGRLVLPDAARSDMLAALILRDQGLPLDALPDNLAVMTQLRLLDLSRNDVRVTG